MESIAEVLRTHDWVADARVTRPATGQRNGGADARTVEVVPTAAGARALRCSGKQHVVAEWDRYLARNGLNQVGPAAWHVTGAIRPASEVPAIAGRPPRLPEFSEIVCDELARSLACRVRIPFELEVFAGHFPSVPVVPGVQQIGWAVGLARQHLRVTGRFRGISTAKFRRMVQPGMTLDLALHYASGSGQLHFEYSRAGAAVSLGRVHFGTADE